VVKVQRKRTHIPLPEQIFVGWIGPPIHTAKRFLKRGAVAPMPGTAVMLMSAVSVPVIAVIAVSSMAAPSVSAPSSPT
jgi:hypothetical protein